MATPVNVKGTNGNDFLTYKPLVAAAGEGGALNGKLGDDQLAGGPQNDWLIGGKGSDQMFGGAGADQFRFDAAKTAAGYGDVNNGDTHTIWDLNFAEHDKFVFTNYTNDSGFTETGVAGADLNVVGGSSPGLIVSSWKGMAEFVNQSQGNAFDWHAEQGHTTASRTSALNNNLVLSHDNYHVIVVNGWADYAAAHTAAHPLT